MTTRRQVMGGVAAAAAVGASASDGRRAARRRSPAFTDAVVDALPSDRDIWHLVTELAALSPASTASASHRRYLDMLERELRAAGIEPRRDPSSIPYWQPHAYSLALDGKPIAVTGYQPYSGTTDVAGIEAPLSYIGRAPGVRGALVTNSGLDMSNVRGRIALIDAPFIGDNYLKVNTVAHCYPESERSEIPADHHSPLFSGISLPPATELQKAGAVGAIYIWNGVSDANAMYQMQSFVARPGTVPTIWVGAQMGALLKARAVAGATARLTLHATIHPDTPTHTLWGMLPGATEEVVIVNTHTDGTNATEENGGIAVVSLARALAKLPRADRRRTYVFVMTAAHFSHGLAKGADDWQRAHPDIMAKTAMALTIEHLGAMEWLDDVHGRYRPTGKHSWATLYTRNRALAALGNEAAASLDVRRVLSTIPSTIYPGEGGPFDRNGVTTLSYMVTPDYLIATPPEGGELAKMSRDRLCDEVRMFARCLERIDAMPIDALKIS